MVGLYKCSQKTSLYLWDSVVCHDETLLHETLQLDKMLFLLCVQREVNHLTCDFF